MTFHAAIRAEERYGAANGELLVDALTRRIKAWYRRKDRRDFGIIRAWGNQFKVILLVMHEGRQHRVVWNIADRRIVTMLPLQLESGRHGLPPTEGRIARARA